MSKSVQGWDLFRMFWLHLFCLANFKRVVLLFGDNLWHILKLGGMIRKNLKNSLKSSFPLTLPRFAHIIVVFHMPRTEMIHYHGRFDPQNRSSTPFRKRLVGFKVCIYIYICINIIIFNYVYNYIMYIWFRVPCCHPPPHGMVPPPPIPHTFCTRRCSETHIFIL